MELLKQMVKTMVVSTSKQLVCVGSVATNGIPDLKTMIIA